MENKHSKRKKNNMDKGTVSGKEKTGHLVNCEYNKGFVYRQPSSKGRKTQNYWGNFIINIHNKIF